MGKAKPKKKRMAKKQGKLKAKEHAKKKAKQKLKGHAKKPAKSLARKAKPKINANFKKPVKLMAKKPKPAAKPMKAAAKKTAHSAKAAPSRHVVVLPAPEKRKPRCLVLAGFGLNAEEELAYSFTLAGADAQIVHFSDIASGARKLENFEIFAIPGGWSFADEISSGRVLGNKLKNSFRSQFEAFVASGKPMLGVCNGFQVLVKLGALPNLSLSYSQETTLTNNASGKFEDRWVFLKPQKSACRYFEGVDFINCPVRHGEGQFVPRDSALLSELEKKGLVVVKYADERLDDTAGYPANPNGSAKNIAGICSQNGKILGLMPHIECAVLRHQFPRFTSGISHEKSSLRFFENIVNEAKKHV